MTQLENIIRPIKNQHAIKEVVVTIFVLEPIEINDFLNIKLQGFSQSKRKIETLKKIGSQTEDESQNTVHNDVAVQETAGVRFISEVDDNISKLLQAVNDSNRNFISYHNFDYDRWTPFLEEYLRYITEIAHFVKDINVIAFSLHYVDEFEWKGKERIEPRKIFNVNSKYLPHEFFNVLDSTFNLLTEKLFETNKCYDRIELKTDNYENVISISHNLIRILNTETKLTDLIKSDNFTKILEWAHQQNKSFLKDVLHNDIINLIHLK